MKNNQIDYLISQPIMTLYSLGISYGQTLYAFEFHRDATSAQADGKYVLPFIRTRPFGEWQEGDQLDAMDKQDYWLPARIHTVHLNSVRIKFERYQEKWDEEFPFHSEKLAPFGTKSRPLDMSVYTIPVCHKLKATGDVIGQPFLLSIGGWYTFDEVRDILDRRVAQFGSGPHDYRLLNFMFNQCSYCGNEGCVGCPLQTGRGHFQTLLNVTRYALNITVFWEQTFYTPITDHDSYLHLNDAIDEQGQNLETCLDKFTNSQEIERTCEKCEHDKSTQQMELWRLPEIMIVQLKRFSYQQGDLIKIDEAIDFPVRCFDALKYVKSINKKSEGDKLTRSGQALENTYDLFAVVNHLGSFGSGHYTTFCHNEESNKWILYNDEDVFEVRDEEIENVVVNSNAYVLFYKKRALASNLIVEYDS